MPEDRTTLTADASQYFDVLRRAGSAADGLGESGERIGRGFLRGERAARTATRSVVVGLSQVQDAGSAALITMQGLERVLRIGFLPTVVAVAGITIAESISRAVDQMAKLNQEVHKLASFSRIGGDFLNTGQITENLDQIGTQIQSLIANIRSRNANPLINFSKSLANLIPGQSGTGLAISAGVNFLNRQDEERIAELRAGARRDVLFLTEKQNDLNAAELDELDGLKDAAELRRAEAESKQRSYNLSKLIVAAGLEGTNAAKQLLSTENDRLRVTEAILRKKQQEKNLQDQIKTATTVQGFLADVGSGRFAKKFADQQQQEIEAQNARRLIADIEEGQSKGFFQNPLSQAILRDARRLAQGLKAGLNDLLNADFTNLLDLSRYDFTGLLPLSGLTIKIQ